MARLNEPPAATAPTTTTTATATATATAPPPPGPEGVDASDIEEVKRRFIRQNRDLAKNNSAQSLRIRTLELDLSRLLAENLELKNQILHLQNELRTAQSQASSTAAQKLRSELQAKIAELSGIVENIEEEDAAVDGRREAWRDRERKPLEGNWRERQPLSELMRDSQMPTIAEDKLYPRRTLGADEIQAIRLSDHSSNESPDLGPPPIARFEYEDPIKNASPLVNKTSPTATIGEDDELPPDLSVNLETRRKRKDPGQPKLQIKRHSLLPQSPAKTESSEATSSSSTILRTGAKRKLADRESEKAIKPPSKGDFTFSRRSGVVEEARSTTTATSNSEGGRDAAEQVQIAEGGQSESQVKPTRKVLGDKSVNLSPRKQSTTRTEKLEKEKDGKDIDKSTHPSRPTNDNNNSSSRRAGRRISSIPLPTPQDEEEIVVSTVEIALPPPPTTDHLPPLQPQPPKTPAEPDLFSPTPSEPSTLHEREREQGGRGDTPPPGDLSALSTTTDGTGVRPSRRAARSGAVNYAEPSLISKMRRPDKKMVDAVKGLQDPRRVMNASGGRESISSISSAPGSASGSASVSKVVVVKKEPTSDDDEEEDGREAWKDLPPAITSADVASSPLTQKSGGEDLPSTPPLPAPVGLPQAANDKPSTSSATISALMAAGRKRRESGQQLQKPSAGTLGEGIGTDIDTAAKKIAELDLYEFKESSSPLASSSDSGKVVPPPPLSGQVGRSKSQRRHSSVPKSDGVSGGDVGLGREGRAERIASRRRSMQL